MDNILNEQLLNAQTAEEIKNLIAQGTDINYQTPGFEESALMCAMKANNLNKATILLESGINIDLQDIYEMTALHHAVSSGFVEGVELLIYHNANPFIKSYYKTPLESIKTDCQIKETHAETIDWIKRKKQIIELLETYEKQYQEKYNV